eukprot:5345328-Pyramimonas_sp.AAC.1
MEGGIDFTSLRQLYSQLQSVDRGARLAELLVTIAAGGYWTRSRRGEFLATKGRPFDTKCP